MRICLVSREYPTDDHGGGIGTYTAKTARALARLGHGVDVITEAAKVEAGTTVEEGVSVHRLEPPSHRLRTLARARKVSRRLEQLHPPPDVVQACEFGAEASWLALRRPVPTRLVTRLATPSFAVREFSEHAGQPGRTSQMMVDTLERQQTRRSDAVITISDTLADLVCDRWRMDRAKVVLMRTGVDFAERHSPRPPSLPAELAGRDYLLYFGRLEERKGVHVLAQALPDVLAHRRELHVVFAGEVREYDGRPMDTWIRDHNQPYADRLHFLPRQPHAELYTLLANAMAVVLPSIWEGLGNVALEAMDMGTAIAATSGSGMAEVIENDHSGLLVPPGDVTALRTALLTLTGDPALRARLSAGARARAREFDLLETTQELVRLYQDVLAGPRRGR